MAGTRKLTIEITGNATDAARAFSQTGTSAGKFDATITRVGGGLRAMVPYAAAAGAAIYGVGRVAWDAIDAASDLNETVSKAETIFGGAADQIIEFGEGAAEALKMSKQEAIDGASTMAIFGKAAGLAGSDLATFSTDLVTLAADLASFHNTSPEQAVEALGAALRGESEPIRAYGVMLSDAVLKQEAMELGIYDGIGALDQQQKVLAANRAILEQTTDAQGDVTRTGGGMAGQMRELHARLADVQAELGQKLLPYAVEFATWINDEGIPALIEFGGWLEDDALPALQAFAGGVADVVDAMGPYVAMIWDQVLPAGQALVDLLQGDLVPSMENLGDALKQSATGPFRWIKQGIEDVTTSTSKWTDAGEAAGDAAGNFVQQMLRARDALRYADRAFTEAREGVGALGDAADAAGDETGEAAEETEEAAETIVESWGRAADAVNEYYDTLLGLNDPQIAFESAVDDMIAAVAEFGLVTDVTSEAGRDQIGTLEDMKRAIVDSMTATFELTGSQKDAEAAAYALASSFVQQATDAGLDADTVAWLARELFGVPDYVPSLIDVQAGGAIATLAEVNAWLDNILTTLQQINITGLGFYRNRSSAADGGKPAIDSGGGGGLIEFGRSIGGRTVVTPIQLMISDQVLAETLIEWANTHGGLPVAIRSGPS